MTRQKIENEYTIVDGRITNPGRFEGEPVYLPYFYDVVLHGCSDPIYFGDAIVDVVGPIDADDVKEFPELADEVGKFVVIEQSEQGFISHVIGTAAYVAATEERAEEHNDSHASED